MDLFFFCVRGCRTPPFPPSSVLEDGSVSLSLLLSVPPLPVFEDIPWLSLWARHTLSSVVAYFLLVGTRVSKFRMMILVVCRRNL